MRINKLLSVIAFAIVTVPNCTSCVDAGMVFWQDEGTKAIMRANADGTAVQQIASTSIGGTGLAVDDVGQRVYWQSGTSIYRATYDGNNIESIVTTGTTTPLGLTVDAIGGKLYWADQGSSSISRANLDGTGRETLVSTVTRHPHDVSVDSIGGKMYWTDSLTNDIFRANLDGSGIESILKLGNTAGFPSPRGIAIDAVNGKVYWTSQGNGRIQRSNLDRSNLDTIYSIAGWNGPDGLAIDTVGGKIYWTGLNENLAIQRASLDGTGVETLINSGLPIPRGIGFVVGLAWFTFALGAVCSIAEHLARKYNR